MRDQLLVNKHKTDSQFRQSSGAALVAIYPKIHSRHPILVGVRKRLIQNQYPVCHLIHVGKVVENQGNFQKRALIPANLLAMQVLVHHVVTLALSKAASVDKNRQGGSVSRQIMSTAGVVERHAEI